VVDVTSYPDITRLYLAADVLVTDYSAAMFDFALTDRRIVLLTPDLEQYRDRVRGLYLDLESMAPGPVVSSTQQVLDVLDVLDDDAWALARKQLCSIYAPHDDGHATARLLDVVLPTL
jgi:CDP-glycerol glycerophosphotransferase